MKRFENTGQGVKGTAISICIKRVTLPCNCLAFKDIWFRMKGSMISHELVQSASCTHLGNFPPDETLCLHDTHAEFCLLNIRLVSLYFNCVADDNMAGASMIYSTNDVIIIAWHDSGAS